MINSKKLVLSLVACAAILIPVSASAAGTPSNVVMDNSKVANVQITNSQTQVYDYGTKAQNDQYHSFWFWNKDYVIPNTSCSWTGNYVTVGQVVNDYNAQHSYSYNVTKKFSNSVTGNVGVSNSVISAGVGFTVTDEYSISETLNVTVLPKTTVTIAIRPLGSTRTFKAYKANLFSSGYSYAGFGTAINVTGKGYWIH